MKKYNSRFLRITGGLLLTISLLTGNLTASPVTAAAQPEEELSQFSSLHRVYDGIDNGYIHYHYEDEAGNQVDLNTAVNTGSRSVRKASNLPSSYDLRTENAVTSIKDQGNTGTCWAFAAIKSAESNLLMKGLQTNDTLDLSESHLAWYAYHPSTVNSDPFYQEGLSFTSSFFGSTSPYLEGGNALIATFVLARWTGLATEETAPFTANTDWELQSMVRSMNSQSETLRYQSDYIVTDAVCYDNASREQIKEILMANGAIEVSYYYDPRFENSTKNSYYQEYIGKKQAATEANHSVTIVGWDDTYSKENFDGRYQPSSDGAWLIANSYGETYNNNNGYFWMSYEEPSLNEFYGWTVEDADTYDNNYQYDGYGWGNPVINTLSDTTEAANIYTANDDYNQSLNAVGIYTVADNQPYTIRIYRNVTAGKPTSGKLAATLSGTEAYQGYHTIRLNEPIALQAGERFSVVISYQRTNSENGYIPLEGISEQDFESSLIYTSNAGESFLYDSSDGSWIDTSTSQSRTIRNNVCVKAFTVNTGAATHLSFSRSSVTLGAGETYQLSSVLQNDSGLEVSYESDDTSVATVNANGKITAKATGSTTVTVALANGIATDITVDVKKAPKGISITPAKKKKLSKNRSFKIKVSLPSGSASNKITYTSSKPGVASVSSSGKVTGRKKGKAVITVKTYNGKKAQLTVTVR